MFFFVIYIALSTVDDVPLPDCGRAIKVECLSDCETEMEVDANQTEIGEEYFSL